MYISSHAFVWETDLPKEITVFCAMTSCNFMDGNNIAEEPSASLLRLGVISALKMEAVESFETVITT
jgi:hypothetical protein